MLESLELYAGLLGLIGLGGLIGMKVPADNSQPGGKIRMMGLIGLLGLGGFWIGGIGAFGAAGSLGLWNHQNPKLALWGKLGWAWLIAIPFAAVWLMG
jgi:hypothetical protein